MSEEEEILASVINTRRNLEAIADACSEHFHWDDGRSKLFRAMMSGAADTLEQIAKDVNPTAS